MAADWIKMRTDLYRDPRVCAMADTLMDDKGDLARYVDQNMQRNMTITRNVTRNAVVGALLSVWGVIRQRGKRVNDDLVLRDMTLLVIDDVSDLPGFGEAMAEVEWVIENDEGLVFPRFFEEHNVEPEVSGRSKAAERQARYRDRKAEKSDVTRDVTRDVTLRPRVEKSREEIKEQEPPPLTPPRKKPERGTRLAEGWMPDNDLITWAREHAPGLLMIELPKFTDYWRSQPGQRGVKLDWPATFRNWLRKAHDHRGHTHGTRQPRTDRRLSAVEQVEQAIRDSQQRNADIIEGTAVVLDS